MYIPVEMEARIRMGRKLSYTKFFSLEGVGMMFDPGAFSPDSPTCPLPPACYPFQSLDTPGQ